MEEENIVKKENEVISNNNSSNNKNVIMAILVVLVIALVGVVIYLTLIKNDDKAVNNNDNNQQQNNNQSNDQTSDNNGENNNQVTDTEPKYENSLTHDDNVESGVYGTVYLEGYAKFVDKPLCDDGPDICQGDEPTVNEVEFYVTNGKVDEIKGWFVENNSGEEYIPLGCLENNIISFGAMADEFYRGDNPNSQEYYGREIKISQDDSAKIIATNENSPITLRIEKKKFKKNIRMGLYRCNSTITGVEVAK